MNYLISREGHEYGPYTLADLQRYVAAGSILVTDLTRSEGMSEWVPVSQVIGNIPVPVARSVSPAAEPPIRREGRKLIIHRGATLPPFCVKCAQPAADPPWEKNFVWCNPLWALLLLVGLLGIIVYIVVYYSTRKQLKLIVPLCDTHRHARRIRLRLGIALLAASPVLLIIAAVLDNSNLALVGFFVLLAMVIVGGIVLTQASSLRPRKIDDLRGLFVGAQEPFLQLIDSLQPQTTGTNY